MLNEFKWRLKSLLSEVLPHYIFSRISRRKNLFVSINHDVLIEGFPRSGNTYLVALLQYYWPGEFKVAHHRHEVGQLRYAARKSIPTIVVIREPLDSIASFVIRENVSLSFGLSLYSRFMSEVIINQKKFLIIDFSMLTKEQGRVVEIISSFLKSNSDVEGFSDKHDEEIKKLVQKMERIDSGDNIIRDTHVALPTDSRNVEKEIIKNELKVKYIEKLNVCESKYQQLKESQNQ